ncbi:hypothetical protein [Xenorhabdus anantnagensis]|uniref:Uncharacterized protein n=1 Tax=Xenorhabdus anantnagensis TaxID=3025875 RepID=A0ABT5LN41_9GAMM|nr:hypothetical protein [Xenorhabdus anantnagensis]MDC9595830.1 hypothetical protein [Xenorhabdus anantnagensis]
MDELRDVNEDIIMLSRQLGLESDDLKLHEPLPYRLIEKSSNDIISKGFSSEIIKLARPKNLTVYQLILQNLGTHRMLLGTPEMIADDMEKWFLEHAADGFNLNFDVFPEALQIMIEHVIPLLQQKNLFRLDYTEQTIRERFGVMSLTFLYFLPCSHTGHGGSSPFQVLFLSKYHSVFLLLFPQSTINHKRSY